MLPTEFPSLFLCDETAVDRAALDALHYPLLDYERYFTASPDEILKRQQMFRDVLNNESFCQAIFDACDQLNELQELVRNLGNNPSDSAENLLYSLVELLTFTDTVEAIDCAWTMAGTIESDRLNAFFAAIRRMKIPCFLLIPVSSRSPATVMFRTKPR